MSVTAPTRISALPQHNALPRALLWSVVVHGIVLTLGMGITAISGIDGGPVAPTTNLAARLHGPPPVMVPAAGETAPGQALAGPPDAPPVSTSPTPRLRPQRPPATVDTPPPATAPMPTPPAASITAPEPPPAINPGSLRAYHLALGRAARPFKTYPPGLREAGVRGRVVIRLIVGHDGRPLALRLIGSSGHAELDEAALTMMQLAASHSRVPDSLLGQAFNIDLAVDFSPDDQP